MGTFLMWFQGDTFNVVQQVRPAKEVLVAGRLASCRSSQRNYVLAFIACIAYSICMQYTIRNVPDSLDEALRRAAREQGKSLNDVAIEALARGAGVTGERGRQRDLSDIAGTWRKDPAFDSALAAQDTIDEGMWR